MPARSWLAELRWILGGGGREEAAGLGILAFEAAAAMSRLVSLYRSLSDVEVRRLRADALRTEGVARLTSADQPLLLRLACGELVADLDRAADIAARLGARCRRMDAPLLRDFDRIYAEAKRASGGGSSLARLDAALGFTRGAAKRFRRMERYVAVTAKLYAEMDALGELEASERRMEQWKRHSGPIPAPSAPAKRQQQQAAEPGEKLMREHRLQREKVRRLTEGSLWSVAVHKVAKLMAKSVLVRVSVAFGASVPGLPSVTVGRARPFGYASGPLHHAGTSDAAIRRTAPILRPKDSAFSATELIKPPASTVGGSGMELRYANMILSAETLLAALRLAIHSEEPQDGMELSTRHELYKMLPMAIRTIVKAKLRGSCRRGQPVDMEAAVASMEAADRVLRWLAPMAHDTVRWHDERGIERARRFNMRPRALMVQTLHFADRQKADAAIVEVLVELSCVCWYDDERRRPPDWDE